MPKYAPQEIELKWQKYWEENKTFRTPEITAGSANAELADKSKKFYCLDMFPYPSGAGLHVGHPEGYTATDIICRYKRAKGFSVLHPMGWDAFGLPAEQYAIQTGTHPAITTQKNCDTFRRQIKRLGLSYDWDREINTTDPKYYKWTQWIFAKLYDTWFDAEQNKGRPISELPIPAEITAKGDAAVREYKAEKRLAYYANAQVWWCRKCKTVCANEEVLADGSHEKCGTFEVEHRNLKQWLLRIPLYAERLLSGLETLDWADGIKDMQRNWIGKSKGAEVDFKIARANADAIGKDVNAVSNAAGKDAVENGSATLKVYTTRPDTLFGATYMVISPEHSLTATLTVPEKKAEVEAYIKAAALKSDLDRTELSKEKTGVFTGSYAINPVNGKEIPIWVADYVLTGYGTGAIMAVPAHDTRDFEFAKKFGIPVICIMQPDDSCPADLKEAVLAGEACWTNDGKYISSSNSEISLNGLSKKEGVAKILAYLAEKNIGKATTNYKIRDWLFSRQRYWGEPFPIVHWEDGEISLVEESEYPVLLPELSDYKPGDGGVSPLAGAADWVNVVGKDGRKGTRELNTMPQWAGSCWYYLRYIDPKNDSAFVDSKLENFWMPVDLYVGGAEHAVLHLLYSRFWHKVLFDLGFVSTDEPFQKLFNQGMILAFAYETAAGAKVPSDEVEEIDGKFYRKLDDSASGDSSGGNNSLSLQAGENGAKTQREELKQIIAKMSKSLKNVVNPDDVVNQYGADSLRLYEMFMGPLDAVKPWQPQGIEGMFRFLSRANRAVAGDESLEDNAPIFSNDPPPPELARLAHQSILKVSDDIENMRFNTAISQLMIFNNELIKQPVKYREVCEIFVKLLHPLAPHLAEELWQILGHSGSLSSVEFPIGDAALAEENSAEVVFQVNGKVRARARLPKNLGKSALEELALKNEQILANIAGKKIVKVIVVPAKLVNLVVA